MSSLERSACRMAGLRREEQARAGLSLSYSLTVWTTVRSWPFSEPDSVTDSISPLTIQPQASWQAGMLCLYALCASPRETAIHQRHVLL